MSNGRSEVAVGVREGDILAGKYRIDKVLGVGGMGVVVAAHHIHLDEKVAIKFLLPDALGNAEAVARFAREARAAVKIKSEHVARVTDVGTLETGAPYMVMEYLEGGDLSGWVQSRGALPVEQAVEFVLQACDAMADAHSIGIIHRDLKPSNLFCIRRNDGFYSVKVLDFGISKMTGLGGSGADMGMTKTTAVMGSPYYMSPEQVASAKDVDPRSDIWAIGVILYELATGRVPFGGETMAELVHKIMMVAPQPLGQLRPDVPEGLEAVILRCLMKDRSQRFLNVAELAVALAPFAPKRSRALVERITRVIQAAGMSASAIALPPSSDGSAQASENQTLAALGRTTVGTSGKKRALVGIAAAIGMMVLGGAIAVAVVSRRASRAVDATLSQNAAPPVTAAAPATAAVTVPPPAPPPSEASAPSVAPSAQAPPLAGRPAGGRGPLPAKKDATTKTSTKKPNCDPNFYLDGSGEKHFKPECF
jgi:eukaryotic-like serine/threonine-protein kinase